MNDDLHDHLHRATEHEPALRTDPHDLLTRAEQHRRSHRTRVLAVGTAGLAALAVAAAVTVPNLLARTPDGQPAHRNLVAGGPAALDRAEIEQACAQQVADAVAFYGSSLPGVDEVVPGEGTYRPGDVVPMFFPGAGEPGPMGELITHPVVLCGLPTQDRTAAQVVDPAVDDTADVLRRCEAQQPREADQRTDLSGATVVTTAERDGRKIALLRTGAGAVQCSWGALPDDSGTFDTSQTGEGALLSATRVGVKTLTEGTGSYYYGAGTVPADVADRAARYEFRLPGGEWQGVDVVDGGYAVMAREDGELLDPDTRVVAADGSVLVEWPAPETPEGGEK